MPVKFLNLRIKKKKRLFFRQNELVPKKETEHGDGHELAVDDVRAARMVREYLGTTGRENSSPGIKIKAPQLSR